MLYTVETFLGNLRGRHVRLWEDNQGAEGAAPPSKGGLHKRLRTIECHCKGAKHSVSHASSVRLGTHVPWRPYGTACFSRSMATCVMLRASRMAKAATLRSPSKIQPIR